MLNLAPQPGETAGFSPERHWTVLVDHATPVFTGHAVLADVDAVAAPARWHRCAAVLGGHAYLDRVADGGSTDRHDPVALAAALRRILMDDPAEPGDQPSHLQGEEKRQWP